MFVYQTIAIGCVAVKLSIGSSGLFVATHPTTTTVSAHNLAMRIK
ncbi:hypothetical protein QUB42_28530 [Microcoleus sp. Aus8_D1]